MLGEPTAQRAARVVVEVFQRLATAASARFIIPGDDEWPDGLADLRHAESIQRRGGEPVGLWLRGPGHLAHLMERSVAIETFLGVMPAGGELVTLLLGIGSH